MNTIQRPLTLPVASARVDFSDGFNDPLEVALHPNVDLVLMEAAGPNIKPGTKAFYHMEIRHKEQPDFHQVFEGQGEMNADGFSMACETKFGTHGAPEITVLEQTFYNPYVGSQTVGQIAPSEHPHPQEQLQVGIGWNADTQVQGQIEGMQVAESSRMVFDSWMPKWQHQGNVAGTPFQRHVEMTMDGVSHIRGRFGDLEESGTISPGIGALRVQREIGPYQIYGLLWFEQPPPPPPPPFPEPPPPSEPPA